MTDLLIPASNNRGPAPALGEPLLEVIRQPLYSAVAFDNAADLPVETRAFQYQVGDTVAGAGAGAIASSLYHTNMETAGALPTPKVFEIDGIRFVISNIGAAGTAADASFSAAAAAIASDLLEDVQRLTWGTMLQLIVGAKEYAKGPAALFPGNAGVDGRVSVDLFDQADLEQELPQAFQSRGKPWSMEPYTIFIPSQQAFHVKVRAPQAATPTVANDRLAWVVLEGRLGREAQ